LDYTESYRLPAADATGRRITLRKERKQLKNIDVNVAIELLIPRQYQETQGNTLHKNRMVERQGNITELNIKRK
jgi:hypothetical protein